MPLPARESGIAAPDPVCRLTVPSPVGALTVFERAGTITFVTWAAGKRLRSARPTPLLAEARDQLAAYFAGKLARFDLPLAPEGTAFQRRVWDALRDIPHGRTMTYGELGIAIGSGARAVGNACGANPVPVLIPCHRVLGADGALHGYSGRGGLDTKARLLALEGVTTSS